MSQLGHQTSAKESAGQQAPDPPPLSTQIPSEPRHPRPPRRRAVPPSCVLSLCRHASLEVSQLWPSWHGRPQPITSQLVHDVLRASPQACVHTIGQTCSQTVNSYLISYRSWYRKGVHERKPLTFSQSQGLFFGCSMIWPILGTADRSSWTSRSCPFIVYQSRDAVLVNATQALRTGARPCVAGISLSQEA